VLDLGGSSSVSPGLAFELPGSEIRCIVANTHRVVAGTAHGKVVVYAHSAESWQSTCEVRPGQTFMDCWRLGSLDIKGKRACHDFSLVKSIHARAEHASLS
jgi:hypothetical protein